MDGTSSSALVFLWALCFSVVDAVGPDRSDRFLQDVAELRVATADIAEQLRSFNELYVGKLESRMVSAATSLSGLHGNMDRLLERAHVWDTLQLHVTAWTEQMHTLSSKMDLLSRAQENISALEARLAALPGLDYRLEAVATRLEDADKRLEMLSRNVDDLRMDVRRQAVERDGEPAVVAQFATRGALASLRVVERKLDKLSQQVQQVGKLRAGQASASGVGAAPGVVEEAAGPLLALAGGGQLVVRCHTAPAAMEILKDVSAKVDVLFDQSAATRATDEEGDDARADSTELDGDAVDNQVTQHRLRRRGRGRRGRKHGGNHTVQAELQAVVQDTLTTLAPPVWTTGSATESMLHLEDQEASATTAPPTATPTVTTEDEAPTEETVNRTVWMTGSWSTSQPPLTGTDDVKIRNFEVCGDKVTRTLEALTQAVRSIALVAAGSAPTAASTTTVPRTHPAGEEPAEPGGCEDLVSKGHPTGLYAFHGHTVYCDMDTDGGGWTVLQRRGDWGEPRVNFSRSWVDYRDGFGDPAREFWIGNKWLHRLTADRTVVLRVDLWDWEGERAVAQYAVFRVAAEDDLFRLAVGNYTGNATDALAAHHGRPFSTWDANHDTAPPCCPCAPAYSAGWWFYSCFEANLNGEYHTHPEENEYYRGIIWEGWRGDYSLRAATLMLRAQ